MPSCEPPPKPAHDRFRPWRLAWRIVRTLLIVYLLTLLAMTLLETWLVYPIPPLARGDWHPAGLNYEDVYFTSADGTKLHGWFVERPQAKRAILYCHGNGEDVGMNADLVAQLSEALDASILIFDYRGYGHSEGTPSEAGCIADGLAAQRWLAQRIGKQPSDVVVMGRSIGSAIATAIAAEQGAQALVLVNAFSRLTDVAAYHYPWLPVRLVMRNQYDSVARIRNYAGPVFQSHGAADAIAPIRFAGPINVSIRGTCRVGQAPRDPPCTSGFGGSRRTRPTLRFGKLIGPDPLRPRTLRGRPDYPQALPRIRRSRPQRSRAVQLLPRTRHLFGRHRQADAARHRRRHQVNHHPEGLWRCGFSR